MRPSESLRIHREAVRAAARRFRLENPRVFGSVARGTDTEASDLDLLVDAPPGTTLFDIGGLADELQTLLGLPVDVVISRELPARDRERLLAEAQPV